MTVAPAMPQSSRIALALVLLAGGVLGYVAWRAPEPSYAPSVPAEDVPVRLSEHVPAGFELREYSVEGMCCQSCAGKLQQRASALADVRAVAVDSVLGVVQAWVADGADDAPIVGALTFEKYSAERAPGAAN
jgi:hypothetical protein